MIPGRCADHEDGRHVFQTHLDVDAVDCSCGLSLTGVEFAVMTSRARIDAACTEPGNAPVGAPYPYNQEHQ